MRNFFFIVHRNENRDGFQIGINNVMVIHPLFAKQTVDCKDKMPEGIYQHHRDGEQQIKFH